MGSGKRWEEDGIENSAAGKKVGRVHKRWLDLISIDSLSELYNKHLYDPKLHHGRRDDCRLSGVPRRHLQIYPLPDERV